MIKLITLLVGWSVIVDSCLTIKYLIDPPNDLTNPANDATQKYSEFRSTYLEGVYMTLFKAENKD
jgi:hypothetical protein